MDPSHTDPDSQAEELAALDDGFTHEDALDNPSPNALEDSTEDESAASTDEEPEVQPATPAPPAAVSAPVDPGPSPFERELAELKASTRQQLDTAFGKVGGLERTLKELRDKAGRAPSLNGSLTIDDFKLLHDEYPEITQHMVNGLNAGLKRIVESAQTAPAPTAPPPASPTATSPPMTEEAFAAWRDREAQAIRDEVRQEVKRDTAEQLLDHLVPQWRTIIGGVNDTTPYRQWLAAQPADYQTKILGSWNPAEISQSIKQFEAAQAPPPTPKPSVPPKPTVQRRVLKAAVPPAGTPRTERDVVMTEAEAMEAGFAE